MEFANRITIQLNVLTESCCRHNQSYANETVLPATKTQCNNNTANCMNENVYRGTDLDGDTTRNELMCQLSGKEHQMTKHAMCVRYSSGSLD